MKLVTLPILLILSAVLYIPVKKNGLAERYGLCKPQISAVYILSMFCVGFLEEMIFRSRIIAQSVTGSLCSGDWICIRDESGIGTERKEDIGRNR